MQNLVRDNVKRWEDTYRPDVHAYKRAVADWARQEAEAAAEATDETEAAEEAAGDSDADDQQEEEEA